MEIIEPNYYTRHAYIGILVVLVKEDSLKSYFPYMCNCSLVKLPELIYIYRGYITNRHMPLYSDASQKQDSAFVRFTAMCIYVK